MLSGFCGGFDELLEAEAERRATQEAQQRATSVAAPAESTPVFQDEADLL